MKEENLLLGASFISIISNTDSRKNYNKLRPNIAYISLVASIENIFVMRQYFTEKIFAI